MKDHFDWLLPSTLTISEPLINWMDEVRPAEFSEKLLNPSGKAIKITSCGKLAKSEKASLKYARFQSTVIDIATVMIYPSASPDILPVFAAEWVAIANRVHVIVLDVELLVENALLSTALDNAFSGLKTKWELVFESQKDKPDWFKEIESPWAIYSSCGIEKIADIKEMFETYLRVCIEKIYKPFWAKAQRGSDHPQTVAYKRHHYEHSPARTIIKKENKDWLETFLKTYHFGVITT